ncbi:MAG: 2-oxoacid:acceptor oxidoreductase family protein [bacterium]
MENVTEIRWHGRGGQGTVTAAKILAEAALTGGKYVQASPEYGPERMGAPLRAYNRISKNDLKIHCQVTNPDIVIVVDPTIMLSIDVTEGTDEDTFVIINTPLTPSEVRKKLGIEGKKIYTVDATKISIDILGKPIPNTPMLGALAKVTGLVTKEDIIEAMKADYGKKFGESLIKMNIEAIERADREVKSE